MRRLWLWVMVVAAAAGCATAPPPRPAPQLYLAVELERGGVVIGAPQVLGLAGKKVTVERKQPGAARPDYHLELSPREVGDGYRLGVRLDAEGATGRGELELAHGEERRLRLDGTLALKVLLLEVDSPEYRAWVAAAPQAPNLI